MIFNMYLVGTKYNKTEKETRCEHAEGSPVTVAPELFVEISAVAVVISK